jgi:large subunit ribosomal protein L24
MQKKLHIKKGDMVQAITGEARGKQGRVLEVDRVRDTAIVEGLRMVKKHSKPTAAKPQGGIVEKEAPIHLSNLKRLEATEATGAKKAPKKTAEPKATRAGKTKKSATKP